ncbi:MAG: hypothetical protein IJL38_07270 [Bacteroidales bacterium]|nr:hypothetical protein [Bacteroidales bacterium]
MNKIEGFYVSAEALGLDVSLTAKMVYALVDGFTRHGSAGCCLLTNEDMAGLLGVSVSSVKRAKRELRELGVVGTDGGIRMWSVGQNELGEGQNESEEGQIEPGGGRIEPHKENINNKEKENNKETYNIGTYKEEKRTELNYLLERYMEDSDNLPLAQYLQEHPDKDVYLTIKQAFADNETHLRELGNFVRSLGLEFVPLKERERKREREGVSERRPQEETAADDDA